MGPHYLREIAIWGLTALVVFGVFYLLATRELDQACGHTKKVECNFGVGA
jgi:hypothetical protein